MFNNDNQNFIALLGAMVMADAIRELKEEQSIKDETKSSEMNRQEVSQQSKCSCSACSVEDNLIQSRIQRTQSNRIMIVNRLVRSAERLRALKSVDAEISDRLSWLLDGISDPRVPADTFSLAVRDINEILDTEFSTLKPGTPDPIDRQTIIEGIRPEVELILARTNLTGTNRCAINALMTAVKDPGISDATLSECIVALHRIIVQVKRYS